MWSRICMLTVANRIERMVGGRHERNILLLLLTVRVSYNSEVPVLSETEGGEMLGDVLR